MVVNFGINRPNISEKHWVHFPESDFSFFRLSFPHNFSPDMAPAGTSSVSCEVSVDPNNLPDTEQLIERVKADLVKCGVLRKDDEVIASTTYFIRYGYCIFDQHRQNALPVIKKWLSDIGIMPCGRYGLWTYFWSDEAILSGLKCGTKAFKALRTAEGAGESALNDVTGQEAIA
jgi:protoporphyrinogen oxidase